MAAANQLRTGSVIDVNGAPHMVETVMRQTPSARGAATLYKIRARNLLTQGKADLSCRGEDTFQEPDFQPRRVQFLYQDSDTCVFMDEETFDQYEMPVDGLRDQAPFFTEDLEEIFVLILEGRPVGVKLPSTVTLEIVECPPAMKGASATSRTKPAVTQTGLTVQVPEHIEQGTAIRIDTETGRFISRA